LATLRASRTGDGIENRVKVVEAHVVRVALCRVEGGMPEERLERGRVAAALAQEAIGEAVPQLMRSQSPDARSLTHAPNETPKSLFASRGLGVLPAAYAPGLRRPLFDLNREDMVVRLRLQLVNAQL
jgi:hypothetical protein